MTKLHKHITKDPSGFGMLPVFIVVGVLSLVGVAGYAVYQASQEGNTSLSRTSGEGIAADCIRGASLNNDTGRLCLIGSDTPVVDGSLDLSTIDSLVGQLSQQELALINSIETTRLGSDSRYLTAIEVSKQRFQNRAPNNGVVLVNGESFIDASSAISMAYTRSLLYLPPDVTSENEIFVAVVNEIKRLGADEVTIVGGSAAVTVAQEATIMDMLGSQVAANKYKRLAGASRIESAIEVAKGNTEAGNVVFVANGYKEADAVLFQGGYEEGPMVFINEDGSMHPATLEFLRSRQPKQIVMLGGYSAVSGQTETELLDEFTDSRIVRISGENRYHTAVAVSRTIFQDDCDCAVYLINSDAQADALMANTLSQSAGRHGPVLYVDQSGVPNQTAEEIRRLRPSKIFVIGGTGRISEATVSLAKALAAGVIELDNSGNTREPTPPRGRPGDVSQ